MATELETRLCAIFVAHLTPAISPGPGGSPLDPAGPLPCRPSILQSWPSTRQACLPNSWPRTPSAPTAGHVAPGGIGAEALIWHEQAQVEWGDVVAEALAGVCDDQDRVDVVRGAARARP